MFGSHWELFGNAYIGALVLAVCVAYVGVYVVLRRIIFFGIGLIQVAALGVAIAFLLGQNPFLWSIITTFLSIAIFSKLQNSNLVTKENSIGIAYIAAGSFSLILLKKSAMGTEELQNFFYGHLLLVNDQQLFFMIIVLLFVLLLHITFFRFFLFVSFDAEMAQTLKIESTFWDFIFYSSLGLIVAVATKTAGSLLMLNYLVLPATTALVISKKMKSTFVYAVLFAVFATIAGLVVQHLWGLPPAQTIAAISVVMFILVHLWQYQKWLSIMSLFGILIGISLVPFYNRDWEEKHDEGITIAQHDHASDEIIINSLEESYTFEPNKELKVSLKVENKTAEKIAFYLSLDFGIDIITKRIQCSAQESTIIIISIPSEVTDFLSSENTVLLSFWEDEMAIIPCHYKIKTTTLLIQQKQ